MATLLGLAWIGLLYGAGLDRERVLATRDVLVFHLPLRLDLARLVADGSAWWNPWIQGGQPVLSNPNYAAFYPPAWLAFVLEPHYALGLGLAFHAALAFAGAWVLVRRLGGGAGSAALAAVGLSGSGAFLSLTHAYTAFTAAAWLPWTLAAADAAFAPAGGGRPGAWRGAAVAATAATLALQLLAGEPMVATASALAVAAVALPRIRRGTVRPVLLRLAAVAVLAALLAAVQLLPTAVRVASSPRAGGVPAAEALTWSLHPARLVEVAFPRAYGDPARYAAGHYFGSPFHDRPYAYLPALHPGLVLLVPGLAALLVGGVPRRWAWRGLALAGLLLALGRFLPLYPFLQAAVPPFTAFRYPEKFAVLPVMVLAFAGALGWGRILGEGPPPEPGRADRRGTVARAALAVAAVVAVVAAAVAVFLWSAPGVATRWIAAGAPAPLSPRGLDRALDLLRGEALVSLGLALAVLGLSWLAGRPGPGRTGGGRPGRDRWVLPAALLLLAFDLHHHGAGLLRWLPAAEVATPPPVVSRVKPGTRLFVPDALVEWSQRVVPRGDVALQPVRTQLARLDPYSGNLWGVAYAFNADFDRMATPAHRRVAAVLAAEWPGMERVLPLLGAWNVGTLILPAETPEQGPFRVLANPHRLAGVRAVGEVRFHATAGAALAAAAEQGYRVGGMDHWIGAAPEGAGRARWRGASEPALAVRSRGGDLEVRYRSAEAFALVVATTHDPRWRARLDGRPLSVHPTALGQLGILVPPGEGRLELTYRDPWVGAGATVTGLTLSGLLVAGLPGLLRRRRRSAPAPST